ncbi:MAG: hypothetical protein LBE38_01285 [Deltaproteobacteria bacterium]|nr:hypothetical protein [Deltaproteobacteria bacterium]
MSIFTVTIPDLFDIHPEYNFPDGYRVMSVYFPINHVAHCTIFEYYSEKRLEEECQKFRGATPTPETTSFTLKDDPSDLIKPSTYSYFRRNDDNNNSDYQAPWIKRERHLVLRLDGDKHSNIRDSTDLELFRVSNLEKELGIKYTILDRLYHIECFGRTEEQKKRLNHLKIFYGIEPQKNAPLPHVLSAYQFNILERDTPGWDIASLYTHMATVFEACLQRDILRGKIYQGLKGIIKDKSSTTIAKTQAHKIKILASTLKDWFNLIKCSPGWVDKEAQNLWDKSIATLDDYTHAPKNIPSWAQEGEWEKANHKNWKLFFQLARYLESNPKVLSSLTNKWKQVKRHHKRLMVDSCLEYLYWINPSSDENNIPTFLTPESEMKETALKIILEKKKKKEDVFTDIKVVDIKSITFLRLYNLSSQLLLNRILRTSTLILRAALGYQHENSQNKAEVKAEYEPCNALIFEDPKIMSKFITNNTWDESSMKFFYADSILHLVEESASSFGLRIMKLAYDKMGPS